jgi:uncharacterized repeat protein (TIGR03803 family)
LYGTTAFGGENYTDCGYGCGTAFVLTRANNRWTENVVHNFGEGKDGYQPGAGPISDAAGNLYGTTQGGGAYGAGTVFQLTPGKNGSWSEKVLHSFNGRDGFNPQAVLVLDAAGNLYGTALGGGAFDGGVAFKLVRGANGKWRRKILHNFGNGNDGASPSSELVFDPAGNLYGTTGSGGAFNQGTVFELTPGTNGGWAEKVLHSFGHGQDGADPIGSVIFDASGNLYGATLSGGAHNGGTVFEITP